VVRRAGALVAAAGIALAAPAGRAAPEAAVATDAPCRAEVSLVPERAFVGQQVIYRVHLFRHQQVSALRWARAPSFPSLRAEWLPGRSPDPRIAGIGDHELVSEERRALFPARAGALEIPPARIACALGEAGARREVEAEVPRARLEVAELPARGRPDDFTGVVGRVEVTAHASPARVALGGSVALRVAVAGAANVWSAAAPLGPGRTPPGVDLYAHPPGLALEAGELLRARRTFGFDLVPRRAGRLVVPAVRVPWFDPERGSYEVAESAAIELEVASPEPAARGPAPAPPAPPEPAAALTEARRGRTPRALVLGAAALAAALGAAAFVLARRAGRASEAERAATAQLERARAAHAAGDARATAEALASALRVALARRVPGAGALAPEELAARHAGEPAVRAAAELLAELDRLRFAQRAGSRPLPDVERVHAALRSLS
jgi:hypothetical protein